MSFDIYGDRLARGHCEVHPHVHQEYPCDLCLSQRSPKQRAPAGPMCGICGEHEACADSCGVAVCSEACDHEARRRHNESETLRARIAELEASNAALRALAELGRWCLTESRENDCSDVGGGSLQDKAIELGLLAYVTVAEPCGEACACMDYYADDEWPHDCLRETERAALKGEP